MGWVMLFHVESVQKITGGISTHLITATIKKICNNLPPLRNLQNPIKRVELVARTAKKEKITCSK